MTDHIQDQVLRVIRTHVALTQDSLMFKLWSEPPVDPIMNVHVYNFTNLAAFLAGDVELPAVDEIGPFVYRATHEKDIQGWSDGQVTFRTRSRMTRVSGQGLDDGIMVTVPNLVLFSGMLNSEVVPQPDYIKRSVVWPFLTSIGLRDTVLTLSAHDYLWGYEDELACVATEDEGADDDLFEATTTFGPPDPADYRTPDGKCMFGVLVKKNATWTKPITVKNGESDLRTKGEIQDIGGSQEFGVWESGSRCDAVQGVQEPSLLPPMQANRSIDLLIDLMCRAVPLMPSNTTRTYSNHVQATRLTPSNLTFHSKHEKCYFDDDSLPDGILGIRKCCHGCPLAVSFPHFLNADSKVFDQVVGVSRPDPAAHSMYLDVEPKLGVLVGAKIRFQVNLVLKPDPAFEPLSKLKKEAIVPLFWAEEGYETPPEQTLTFLNAILALPGILAVGTTLLFLGLGAVLLIVPMTLYLRHLAAEQQQQPNSQGARSSLSESRTCDSSHPLMT